ncbi:MAG TPA: kelch repeat-containing protein, partial [Myxococcaceae bacterium]|nr:kelch repeat-containing protein [Myxococcaceae bacterium]
APQQVTDAGPPVDAGTPLAAGWTALRQLPAGLGETAVAAADGKIYVVGGYDTEPVFQIYDIASDTWSQGPALLAGTDNAGAVAANGKVYVFGGEASPVVQIYDVAQRRWSAAPTLPVPRFSSVVEQVGSLVHLVGGWSFDRLNNTSIASHTVFDLAGNTYLPGTFAPLQTARNHAYSGVIDGKLYVTGGRAPGHEAEDGQNVSSTEVYDPATNTWSPLPDLPTPRSGGASAVLGGKLYVLGGGLPGATVYKTVERFSPQSGAWERLGDMPIELTGHRATAVGHDLYVVGGFATRNGQRVGFGGVKYFWRYSPP